MNNLTSLGIVLGLLAVYQVIFGSAQGREGVFAQAVIVLGLSGLALLSIYLGQT